MLRPGCLVRQPHNVLPKHRQPGTREQPHNHQGMQARGVHQHMQAFNVPVSCKRGCLAFAVTGAFDARSVMQTKRKASPLRAPRRKALGGWWHGHRPSSRTFRVWQRARPACSPIGPRGRGPSMALCKTEMHMRHGGRGSPETQESRRPNGHRLHQVLHRLQIFTAGRVMGSTLRWWLTESRIEKECSYQLAALDGPPGN